MAAGIPGKHKQSPLMGRQGTVKSQPPSGKPQAMNPQCAGYTNCGSNATSEPDHVTNACDLRRELCETEVALMNAKLWATHRTPRSTPISARSGGAASVRSGGETSTRSGGKASTEISSLRSPRSSVYSHSALSRLENQVEADQQVLQIEISALSGLLSEVTMRAAAWERGASAPIALSAARSRSLSSDRGAAGSYRRPSDESTTSGSAAADCAADVLKRSHKISQDMRHLSHLCCMAISHSASLKESIQDLCQQYRSPSRARQSCTAAGTRGGDRAGHDASASSPRLLCQPPGKVSSDAIVPVLSPRQASLSPRPRKLLQASHTEPVLELRSPRVRANQEQHAAQRANALFRMMQKRVDDNHNLCKEARALGTRAMRFLASTSLETRSLEAKVAQEGTQERSLSPTPLRPSRQLRPPTAAGTSDLKLRLKEFAEAAEQQKANFAASLQRLMPRNGVVNAVDFQCREPSPLPHSPKSPRFQACTQQQRLL